MSTLLDRVARAFVAPTRSPAGTATDRPGPALVPAAPEAVRWLPPALAAEVAPEVSPVALPLVGPAPSIAVVCAPGDARLAGAATALALARLLRAPCGLVAEWTGADPGRIAERPSVPAARRLAAGLRERGHAAAATGRLAVLGLPPDEGLAIAAARAVALDAAAAVLVVAGPRGAAVEERIAELDLVLLAGRADADAELAALAAGELERLGPPVIAVELPGAVAAAALARWGVALAGPLQAVLAPALEAALR